MPRTRVAAFTPVAVAVIVAACVGADAPKTVHYASAAAPEPAEPVDVRIAATIALAKRLAPKRLDMAVTFQGAEPLYPGMSLARAVIVLEGDLWQLDKSLTCSYFRSARTPGMKYLFLDRRLARIEVDTGTTTTADGLRIGSTEEEVYAMYPGRVTTTDDTFSTGGHFLSIAPPEGGDTTLRIVFETDGKRVTRFRTGIKHVVEWAEGCS